MSSASPSQTSCPVAGLRRYPLPRQDPMRPPAEYAEGGREQQICRITQWNGAPAWFVTRFEDIRALLKDPRLSADAASPNYPAQTAALALVRREYQVFAQMDPPEHTSERKLLAGEFSGRRVEQLRPRVQALVDSLIDRIEARKPEA